MDQAHILNLNWGITKDTVGIVQDFNFPTYIAPNLFML